MPTDTPPSAREAIRTASGSPSGSLPYRRHPRSASIGLIVHSARNTAKRTSAGVGSQIPRSFISPLSCGGSITPLRTETSKPEPQPVVAAIVTNAGCLLVTWRNDKNPPAGFLSGEIEPGESPAGAVVREVKEEAGLRVTAGVELGRRVHPKARAPEDAYTRRHSAR